MTEHWFDRLARDAVARRMSGREIISRGARTMAAGSLLGATWSAAAAPAAGGAACGLALAPECDAVATEATSIARDACLAEKDPQARVVCTTTVNQDYRTALVNCLRRSRAAAIRARRAIRA
jgi:hypothetical protein